MRPLRLTSLSELSSSHVHRLRQGLLIGFVLSCGKLEVSVVDGLLSCLALVLEEGTLVVVLLHELKLPAPLLCLRGVSVQYLVVLLPLRVSHAPSPLNLGGKFSPRLSFFPVPLDALQLAEFPHFVLLCIILVCVVGHFRVTVICPEVLPCSSRFFLLLPHLLCNLHLCFPLPLVFLCLLLPLPFGFFSLSSLSLLDRLSSMPRNKKRLRPLLSRPLVPRLFRLL
mmetsp:Transcript_33226/g.65946  ORF Transcript_33226/g.65946 Transcript_33226/m.65946 type:complete len:225 (-) Transcript_33226:274-948(-)